EGFLVIGGRDSTTNDILIKKFTEKNDLIFHTEMAGSPFFVVRSENKEIGGKTKQETSDAVVSYSRAWKLGVTSTEVYYVSPEQLTKKAPTGEYIKKGAFMIYGKKEYITNHINLAIGITKDGKIMGAPLNAISFNCEKYVEIKQGRKKSSEIAKFIQRKIGGELDDIIRAMPSGGCEVK
ncbi:MAG: NFACT RNA binding domain-containing protein, partial [Nanoarchaeota archaeon]